MNREKLIDNTYEFVQEVYTDEDCPEKANKRLMQAILIIDEIVCDTMFTKKLVKKLNKTLVEDEKYDL